MNIQRARDIIRTLHAKGVKEFCLCAGARNAPFVELLTKSQGLKVYHFFEERSAAFFALGRIKAEGYPVAVITTSGTAAAELLPATIEAFYTNLPLVLVTADRPRSYRHSGAPQSILHLGLYSHYIEQDWDLESEEELSLDSWSGQAPIHINVCFAEPLIDESLKEWEVQAALEPEQDSTGVQVGSQVPNAWRDFLQQSQKPLLILSELPRSWQPVVKDFAKKMGAVVYAEALSGLREDPELQGQRVEGSDKAAKNLADKGEVDGVIRIGGVPSLRFWRDLEDRFSHLPVLSFSPFPFSGLSRVTEPPLSFANLQKVTTNIDVVAKVTNDFLWKPADKKHHSSLMELFSKYPRSEASLIHQLSKALPEESRIYLGNSLPIREWDLAASYEPRGYVMAANRGVNGIDGQVSTFLGWCQPGFNNVALLGDLTALYDLSGLWPLQGQIPSSRVHLVVMNNSGGRIFSRLFTNKAFENEHELDFAHWAAMWKLRYKQAEAVDPAWFHQEQAQVIELVPSSEQTKLFWQEYDALWTR